MTTQLLRPIVPPIRLTEIGFEPVFKDIVGKPGGDIDHYAIDINDHLFRVYIKPARIGYTVKCDQLGEHWEAEYETVKTPASKIKKDLENIAHANTRN